MSWAYAATTNFQIMSIRVYTCIPNSLFLQIIGMQQGSLLKNRTIRRSNGQILVHREVSKNNALEGWVFNYPWKSQIYSASWKLPSIVMSIEIMTPGVGWTLSGKMWFYTHVFENCCATLNAICSSITGACVENLDIAEKKTQPYEKSTRVVAILPPCSLQPLFSHLKF